MLPTIWPEDTLMIEHVGDNQFRIGDVVLVEREGRLCTHRLVSKSDISDSLWITQGDAMAAPDPPVTENELLGRVTHIIRAGRSIPVSPELSLYQRLVGEVVRRSSTIARVLVYLHGMVRKPESSVAPCQG
jgi:hypothetical protein